ncbi:MAG: hypothetical protein ACREIT_02375 [Tepidisphaeraceae bacterium]
MADQNPPVSSKDQAPDPARSYERAKPEAESGMGRLDNDVATPTDSSDKMHKAVGNRQKPKQINADDIVNERDQQDPNRRDPAHHQQDTGSLPPQPDHSMLEEEPDGWDQAPTDIHNPRHQRHPRTGGKGGTPNAGEARREG